MLSSAARLLTDCLSLRPERRLNAARLLTVLSLLLLAIALLGAPSAAAAVQPPLADDWWAPSPGASNLPPTSTTPTHIFGVGDSVMLGASYELKQAMPGIEIDAVVGRQASTGLDILRARAAQGDLPDVVIFGLGTNGPL